MYFIYNAVPFDELVFFQENKSEVCKKYNLNVFIDDKERVLTEVKNVGVNTIRITNECVSNHKIVHNWQ